MSALYARIDMVRKEGRQLLLEAEVNEPGLLFQFVPSRADVFVIETGGNDLDNVIVGSVAANRLDGGAGADSLDGGEGGDT